MSAPGVNDVLGHLLERPAWMRQLASRGRGIAEFFWANADVARNDRFVRPRRECATRPR
jgi:hypothetical protein